MAKFHALIQTPPPARGEAEQQLTELRDYLYTIVEELCYVLTHLEADNIDDGMWARIQSMLPMAYSGLPPMDGEASSGTSAEYSRGDHRHPTDTSLVSKEQTVNGHALTGNVTVTKGDVGLGNVANERQYSAQNPPPAPSPGDIGAIPNSAKGAAGGVAELDSGGRVPSSQLPSYVDDVLEYPTESDFPPTGETGKIYVAEDTNVTYRWSGSAYVEISASLALGETSSTAYRGDRGKTAYDHSQTVGNPHGTTAAEVGARADDWMPSASDVGARPDDWMPSAADVGARPDNWTPSKSDIGLGNVENERQYSALNPPPLPTPGDIGAVPTTREINGHPLSADIDLDASDVGARADTWMPTAADVGARANTWTPSKSDIGLGNVENERQYSAQNPPPVPDADDIPYDNTGSGLTASDVRAALDELAGGGGGGGPSPSDTNPLMDGTAAAGTAMTYSRSDHVHPSDTNKQAKITANGILKGDGLGGVSAATAGTDYATPGMIPTVPSASSANPKDLGTAAAGSSSDYSRADHVHKKPSASDIGAYVKPSGGIPATDLAAGVIPSVPSASTANPQMDGTASAGSSTSWSRGDHVHPKDTSKADLASEIVKVSIASFNSLPKTVSNAAIKSGHEVVGYYMSNQAAMASAWTWTTANGSLTISGTINGSTTLTVYLGLVGTTV